MCEYMYNDKISLKKKYQSTNWFISGEDGINKPPAYLSVDGHKDCLGSHTAKPEHTYQSVCLPKTRPNDCLFKSWQKLKQFAANGILEKCNMPPTKGNYKSTIVRQLNNLSYTDYY